MLPRNSSTDSLKSYTGSPRNISQRPSSDKSKLSRSLSNESFGRPKSIPSTRRISAELPLSRSNSPQIQRLSISPQTKKFSISEIFPECESLLFEIEEIRKVKSAERDFNKKGVVWLEDGRLVIINYGNDEIKVFNTKFVETLSRKIPEGCRGISGVRGTDVAVTCQRRVFHYSVGDKAITEGKCFALSGNTYGIAFAREHFGVTVDIGGENKSIALLNEEGRVLHQLEKVQKTDGTIAKSFHLYLTMDPDRNVIYISDIYHDRLQCVSFTEKLYWEVELPGKPRGACVIGSNIVVGVTGGKLCVVTKQGEMLKVIPDLGYDPESLAFDYTTQRLAVSQYYKGWVHVYQMT